MERSQGWHPNFFAESTKKWGPWHPQENKVSEVSGLMGGSSEVF